MSRATLSPPSSKKSSSRNALVPLDEVQHFVMEGASWELYERLLRDIGNRPIRVTYDEGRLEVMSPLPEHERPSRFIGRMIEMLTFELDIPTCCLGSTTFRRRDKKKGLEPDQCYYFKNEARMRGRKRLNLKRDPAPELVVEVDITSRSVPREPIYAALGVPEIWRYDGRRIECPHLVNGAYAPRKHSLAFPFLEPAQLQRFVSRVWREEENSVLRAFLAWGRKSGRLPR